MENFKNLLGNGALLITALSFFVEISPIKINPITTLLRALGRKINAETLERVESLEKKIDNVETMFREKDKVDAEKNAVECRIRILRFGDEIRRGTKHSLENFNQTNEDIQTYTNYCMCHPEFSNGKTVMTIQKINEVYTHCMDTNDFI